MTKYQSTGLISLAVSILIMAILISIVSSKDRKYSRDYTRSYVDTALVEYDSVITAKQMQQWDTTNARLLRISKQLENE